jgi:phytoene desaturase
VAGVIVIGAGVGGLAAATRLAVAGHRVAVFEQATQVGGKLGRHEHATDAGTFRFDTGPSLLTLPHILADLFATAGANLSDELDLVALDPVVVRHVFPDGARLDSSSDPTVFAGRIEAAFGPAAALQWARLWRRARRCWEISSDRVLMSNVDSWRTVAGLAWRLDELAAVAPGRTLRGVGRSYLTEPHLRTILDRYATYVGSDPRRAPAALLAVPYAELAHGGWYVRGGLALLGEALLRLATAAGVTVHTGARVERIETAGGRVAGIRLADGTAVAADVVVANVDALALYTALLPRTQRAARLRHRSLGGFVLLVGLRGGRTPGLAHHTVFFPDRYDDEFDALFARPVRPVADPAIFVTSPDDPLVCPPDHEAWFVLVNAPPHGPPPWGVDWRAPGLADTYADRVLAALARRGVDVRDRVLFRDVRTPADLEQATGSPGGAIYGTPSHGLTGLLRPPNRGAVRGLFHVGGSSHPGGGLPMVALSAKIVADLVGPP